MLIILLLAGLGWLIYGWLSGRSSATQPVQSSSAYIDPEASAWEVGIEPPKQDAAQESILIPGYSGASMLAGDTVLKLRIGNPEDNTCYLKATLQLEDGTVLYESGLLEPGSGFEQIELNQTLEAGTYEAWVHYQGYSMDEARSELNGSDSAFTLTVTP